MHSSTSVALVLAAILVVLAFAPGQSQSAHYGTVDFAIWNDTQCVVPWTDSDNPQNQTFRYVDLSSNNCYNFSINDTGGATIPIAFRLNCSNVLSLQYQWFYQQMWFNATNCSGPSFEFSHSGPVGACNPFVITFNGTNQFNGSTIPTLYSQLICTETGLPSSSSSTGPVNPVSSISSSSSSSGRNAATAAATFNTATARFIVFALIAAATAAAILI